MLDIRRLRRDPGSVTTALARRGLPDASETVAALLERDRARREALGEVNELKSLRNRVSKRIGEVRREGATPPARLRECAK